MKMLIPIIALLFALPTAKAASVLEFTPYVSLNAASQLQADIKANLFDGNVEALNGTWFRSLYAIGITAKDGGLPVAITKLNSLSITISSNTTISTTSIDIGLFTFNAIGSSPGMRAYDSAGNDITVSAGLQGQNILTDLAGKGVFEILSSDWRVQTTPAATFGGLYTVNSEGNVQTATFAGSGVVAGNTVSGSAFATTTIVPEPADLWAFSLLGLMAFRRRPRG